MHDSVSVQISQYSIMSDVDPLSEFTIVRPNAAQKEAYLKAQFVPWNRGLSWEVSVLARACQSVWWAEMESQGFVEIDKAAQAEAWSTNGGEQAWSVPLKEQITTTSELTIQGFSQAR